MSEDDVLFGFRLRLFTLAEYQSTSTALGYLCTPSEITSLFGSSQARGTFTLTKTTLWPESIRMIWSNCSLVKVPLLPRWTITT